MTDDNKAKPAAGPDEAPHSDVTAGAGRRDEVGKTGIYPATAPDAPPDAEVRTPGDINSQDKQVRQDSGLRGAERLERPGTEPDKPDIDPFDE
jgi:hypothetical protein